MIILPHGKRDHGGPAAPKQWRMDRHPQYNHPAADEIMLDRIRGSAKTKFLRGGYVRGSLKGIIKGNLKFTESKIFFRIF